jgi:cytochrome c-type biogenesis protein CcmE
VSRLDDELARAAAQAQEPDGTWVAPDAAQVGTLSASNEPEARRRVGLLLALLLMGAAVLVLVLTSAESATIYSKGVDELVRERERLASRHVRVDGTLVSGTLRRRDQPCEYRFQLEKNGAKLDVQYPGCVVPDTFRDLPGVPVAVTVEGTLSEAGHLAAERILAKCPSKYDMDERAKQGERVPHRRVPVEAGPRRPAAVTAASSHPD